MTEGRSSDLFREIATYCACYGKLLRRLGGAGAINANSGAVIWTVRCFNNESIGPKSGRRFSEKSDV